MILAWNNISSYKQHQDDMKTFREIHKKKQTEQLRDMPALFKVRPPKESGLINNLTDKKGKVIFVPIWRMTLARGINN